MAPYAKEMRFPTTVLVVNTIGLAISFLAVGLRFWARLLRGAKIRLSDYTIVASWLFTFGLVVSENFCVTRGGVGQAASTVTLDQLLFSAKQFVTIGVCGTLAVTFVKISILDLFISLFSSSETFRKAALVLMAITASYGTSFTIVTLAGCRPFEANWDKLSHPDYKCINTSKFYVAQCAIGTALDCTILVLPLFIIWKLKLKTSKKLGLNFLFTIGILICGISLARLVYNTRQNYMTTNFTEYAGVAALLGALEANLSIVCACIPLLQPIITSLSEKIRSRFGSNTGTLRGLLRPFSSRSRQPTRGSIKLDSLTDRPENQDYSQKGQMESAREREQIDRLYPVSLTTATLTSIDGGAGQTHYPRTVDSEYVMDGLGEGPQQQSSINVTKTWDVR